MKYGDFASVVQLGVGLHLGTALLQLYGELGLEPLVRAISRARSLFSDAVPEHERPPAALKEELERLESRFDIFKIRLFNEYKKYVRANSFVALVLAAILAALAFYADVVISDEMSWSTGVMVFLSLAPAPISLGALWLDAGRLVAPMKAEADDLERRAVQAAH
jgi:hypothetical protein